MGFQTLNMGQVSDIDFSLTGILENKTSKFVHIYLNETL